LLDIHLFLPKGDRNLFSHFSLGHGPETVLSLTLKEFISHSPSYCSKSLNPKFEPLASLHTSTMARTRSEIASSKRQVCPLCARIPKQKRPHGDHTKWDDGIWKSREGTGWCSAHIWVGFGGIL